MILCKSQIDSTCYIVSGNFMNRKSKRIVICVFIIAFSLCSIAWYRIYKVVHIKRDPKMVRLFLRNNGLSGVPRGYQVDHIIPLCAGGDDSPDNMQLLSVKEHKKRHVAMCARVGICGKGRYGGGCRVNSY